MTWVQQRLAGWYPDPRQPVDGPPAVLRWWDGRRWSDVVLRWNGSGWVQRVEPASTPARGAASAPLVHVADPTSSPGGAEPPRTPPSRVSPPAAGHRPRRTWLIALVGAVGLLALAGAGLGAFLLLRPDPERAYLEELRAAGLGGQYTSDANAVASGTAACTRMRSGEPQTGSAGDEIAVRHFCPEFSQGFHVLREITVAGEFSLIDNDVYSSIDEYGSLCEGTGGYSDITQGTSVVLKNGEGKILATTSLGPGSGSTSLCVFEFTLPVKEGESDYVVSVSDRGEMHYTFTQLDVDGISLTLGD